MVSGYEWDEAKRRENREKHGVDFESIAHFDWNTALVTRSDRDGEVRYMAIGYLEYRLHCLVFTERGENVRVISLRRASAGEREIYDQAEI